MLRIVPLPVMRGIGSKLGHLFGQLPLRDVQRCRQHLRRAYPQASEDWIIKTSTRCFMHFGRSAFTILYYMRRPNTAVYPTMVIEGRDHYRAFHQADRNGEGTILVGGHFGNWELQMRFMLMTGKFYSVGKRLKNKHLNQFVTEHLRKKNNYAHIIYQDQGLLQCARALRKGASLTIIPDQDLPSIPGVFSRWFSIPAWTPSAPAKLARLQGTVIQPCFLYEHQGKLVFHWGPRKSFEQTDDSDADIQHMTDWIMAYQEQLVRRHPEQWVWWHRRWRTRPQDIASASE